MRTARLRWAGSAAAVALLAGAVLWGATTPSARAQEGWRLEAAPDATPDFERPAVAPAPDGPPDAGLATRDGGDIVAAWYSTPTTRYRHGALGDAIEAAALAVRTAEGGELRLALPESEVFEDVTPRLADLDGDGRVEVVAIRSSTRAGAAVTLYGLEDGRLVERASTPFIGRSNRWLNIAAIAPFLGGDELQIAYVETPHIGGVLRLWAYRDGALIELGSRRGFSNHAIGDRELGLAATADFDDDGRHVLALPADGRRILRVVAFEDGGWIELASFRIDGEIRAVRALAGREPRILVRAERGVFLLAPE